MRRVIPVIALLMIFGAAPGSAEWISEETPPISCGNRLLAGISCAGKFCDRITPICGRYRHEIDDIHWTGFVSEEGRGEMHCDGNSRGSRREDYRRDDRRRDDRRRDSRDDRRRDSRDDVRVRGGDSFITGLACQGDFCDRLALECVSLNDAYRGRRGRCEWTRWVSEEQRSLSFPRDYAAVAMSCRGDYCDDKSFLICPVR